MMEHRPVCVSSTSVSSVQKALHVTASPYTAASLMDLAQIGRNQDRICWHGNATYGIWGKKEVSFLKKKHTFIENDTKIKINVV